MTHYDVIVVGAGPAGIAAAVAAARHGRSVALLDDNPFVGGQIWRGGREASPKKSNPVKDKALSDLAASGVTILSGYSVFDAPQPGELRATQEAASGTESIALQYRDLILATGARERFLPFPGWTLPGVFGAGGLQALVKGGFDVRGKRIAVAGSGPLLLAVAVHLKEDGAQITSIAEQAPISQLLPFALSLWSHPAKIKQAIEFRIRLERTPYRTGCWPIAAIAHDTKHQLKGVLFTDGAKTWEEPCDLLACGFHLVPNTELASLLGCSLSNGFVETNNLQQTSMSHIYCVGEPTGIAGLEAALLEGEIAGLTCAAQATASFRSRIAVEHKFAARMTTAFQLRPELRSLCAPDTIVCRCEDVTHGSVAVHTSWTDAKLQTRCGMGPCQGRICGPAVETLFGWQPKSIRPPLFPVPINTLCFQDSQPDVAKENA